MRSWRVKLRKSEPEVPNLSSSASKAAERRSPPTTSMANNGLGFVWKGGKLGTKACELQGLQVKKKETAGGMKQLVKKKI